MTDILVSRELVEEAAENLMEDKRYYPHNRTPAVVIGEKLRAMIDGPGMVGPDDQIIAIAHSACIGSNCSTGVQKDKMQWLFDLESLRNYLAHPAPVPEEQAALLRRMAAFLSGESARLKKVEEALSESVKALVYVENNLDCSGPSGLTDDSWLNASERAMDALTDLRGLILEAEGQKQIALPELPITPYRRGSDGAHLYDAMIMHQYAIRYAALGEKP